MIGPSFSIGSLRTLSEAHRKCACFSAFPCGNAGIGTSIMSTRNLRSCLWGVGAVMRVLEPEEEEDEEGAGAQTGRGDVHHTKVRLASQNINYRVYFSQV